MNRNWLGLQNEGRVIITFSVAHFTALHAEWLRQGKHRAGIVVSIQRPLGDLLRRVTNLSASHDAAAMCDRIEFLSDW